MQLPTILGKPGLFVRVANLIILQGVFVFGALALVLFYPAEDSPNGDPRLHEQQSVQEFGQRVAECYIARLGGHHSDSLHRAVDVALKGSAFMSAGLFVLHPDGGLECVYSLDQGTAESPSGGSSPVVGIDDKLVRLVAGQAPGFVLSAAGSGSHRIHYFHSRSTSAEPVVFSAVSDGRYVVTSRSELAYVILVLFLVSTLVSLLTVYLIWKRFKQPLHRLSLSLEKTAGGEMYCQTAADVDEELGELAGSANRIAQTLWDNQQEMKSYDTRLRHVHRRLVESRRFLSTIVDCTPSCVVVTSADGEIILYNQEAQKTFGYSQAEVLGKPISELIALPPEQPGRQDKQGRVGVEAICHRHDQSRFPVYVVTAPVRGENSETIAHLFILHDITESKSFQEMMVRLDRYSTRGEMSSEIAHEINNYLAVLSGNLELMPLLMKRGDQEKIAKKLELMRSTTDKIAKFTDGLMDAGPDETVFEPANINQIVENVIAFLKPQNKYDRVELRTNLDGQLPHVVADAGQIQQLLVNLINNAADAFAEKKIKGSIAVTTSPIEIEGRAGVGIRVQDDGPGVPTEKVEGLFSNRFTTKKRGHGIGLITCKKIVDAHQGYIRYEYQGGAVFVVELPLTHSENPEGVPDNESIAAPTAT